MKKNKQKTAPLLCWDVYYGGIQQYMESDGLPVGGFLEQSLIDYPGNISAVVFTQGCNLRCEYCHNPGLVFPDKFQRSGRTDIKYILSWIRDNKELLDAVVVTGGEPTIHDFLPGFISRIRNLGLKVKLDTNGTNSEMLENLIIGKQVDYIAMDIKAPLNLSSYREVAGNSMNRSLIGKIKRSVDLIIRSGIDYEFRTTLLGNYHTTDSIKEIAAVLSGKLYLQNFQYSEGIMRKDLIPFPGFDKLGRAIVKSTVIEIRK
ncbi:MAG: anaerobic ribonucleoside-triphosphate reductase activating protein [Bacteroidales bacterium]|jgi:pyruvate formate lyase activating enzyme